MIYTMTSKAMHRNALLDERVNMNVIETEIGGVKFIEPDVFGDERGWGCETCNAERCRR